MLSKTEMVNIRKAIEMMYQDTCDVVVYVECEKPNGATGFVENVAYSDVPCRISFESKTPSSDTGSVSIGTQQIRLFIAPEVVIPGGSKIIVSHLGEKVEYKNSGVSAKYNTHQEITLELFDTWM